MQRYDIYPRSMETYRIKYVGGVGDYDVFWIGTERCMIMKWSHIRGLTVRLTPTDHDASSPIYPLPRINEMLQVFGRKPLSIEEHTVLQAMRKLFIVD